MAYLWIKYVYICQGIRFGLETKRKQFRASDWSYGWNSRVNCAR